MTRAIGVLIAATHGALADLPSPLFCNTVALCETANNCVALDTDPHFVLRQTGGEWVMVAAARGAETWVVLGASADAVLANAPTGARIAMVEAGTTGDGAIVLHQHSLETAMFSPDLLRHECWTSDENAT